ncbi:MAG TPA: ADP-ribosylglycohydrolase family protein [Pseudonocardiaceae bacterium]
MIVDPKAWPPVTEADREEARRRPGEWLPVVDPEFDRTVFGHLPVPEPAVLGWREVDAQGEFTGQTKVNGNYRPGPRRVGMYPPSTPVDALLGFQVCRWLDREGVLRGLLDLDVLVPVDDKGKMTPRRDTPDGPRYLTVFSAEAALPPDCLRWNRLRVRELALQVPSLGVRVNDTRHLRTSRVTNPHDFLTVEAHPGELTELAKRYPGPRIGPEAMVLVEGPTLDQALVPRIRETLEQLDAPSWLARFDHLGVTDLDSLVRHILGRVEHAVGAARGYGVQLTAEDCARYAVAYAWKLRNDRTPDQHWPEDPLALSLDVAYDAEGRPRPTTALFGVLPPLALPEARLAWHRIVGAYVGFALGDALGSAVDQLGWDMVVKRFGPTGITDLLPAFGAPGRFSALTQQLLFLTEGVLRGASPTLEQTVDAVLLREAQHALQRWLHTQGVPWSQARGPANNAAEPDGWLVRVPELHARRTPEAAVLGATTRYATSGLRGRPDAPGTDSAGPAALTAALPGAVLGAYSSKDLPYLGPVVDRARALATLTHGHPTALSAVEVLTFIVFEAMRAKPVTLPVHQLVQAAIKRLDELAEQGKPVPPILTALLQRVRERYRWRHSSDPAQMAALGMPGTAVGALARGLLAAAKHGHDPRSALLAAVNHHAGHSAASGAVAGMLVGARYGVRWLPREWVEQLELRFVLHNLAADVFMQFNRYSPLAEGQEKEWLRRYPRH